MSLSNEQFPLVTVVSPCYNHQEFVIESLDSIRRQTYPNIQHIIIDDCSRDHSVKQIEQWIGDHKYSCQFIKHEVNKGISATLNESIRLAKGKYWSPLATDDYIKPSRTERFVSFMEEHPETLMVVSDTVMVDSSSKVVEVNGTSSFLKHYGRFNSALDATNFGTYQSLLYGNYMPGSLMVRTDAYKKVGFYPEHLKLEDWDMWLRISRYGKIELVDEPLTYYRWHSSNSVANRSLLLRHSIQTLISQRSFCQENRMKKAYEEAYTHYFNNAFSPLRDWKNSFLFLSGGNLSLFTRALLHKVKAVLFRNLKGAKQ